MQDNPFVLLQLMKGCPSQGITDYKLENLRIAAEMLSDECLLNGGHTFEDLAELTNVGERTARIYVNTFRRAFEFSHGIGDRDDHVAKALKGNLEYVGVACLLVQKVVDPSRYQSVRRIVLESEEARKHKEEKAKAKEAERKAAEPGELKKELEVLRKDLAASSQLKRVLKKELEAMQQDMKRLIDLETQLAELAGSTAPFEGAALLTRLAHLFNIIGKYMIKQHSETMVIAEKLKDMTKPKELDLPTHTVWSSQFWVRVVTTDEFKATFMKLSPIRKKEFLQALLHLSIDWRYGSLRSHKLDKSRLPKGVPFGAMYSHASDKLRFYWNIVTPRKGIETEGELTIHRLEEMRG